MKPNLVMMWILIGTGVSVSFMLRSQLQEMYIGDGTLGIILISWFTGRAVWRWRDHTFIRDVKHLVKDEADKFNDIK